MKLGDWTPSDSGPWRRYSSDFTDEQHVVPGFGKKHLLDPYCWCYPHVQEIVGGDLVTHNVAQ